MKSIVNNFFQKPLGILTAVTAAIGGPYAVFETDLGTSIRRSLVSVNASDAGSTNNSGSSLGNLSRLDSSDPLSLRADLAQVAFRSGQSGGSDYVGQSAAPTGQFPIPGTQTSFPSSQPSSASNTSTSFGSGTTAQYPYYAGPSVNGVQSSGHSIGAGLPVGGASSSSINASGQLVTTMYGPATITPIGPSVGQAGFGQPQPNAYPLEVRSGPASVVPGSTDQLWDYTLGTPTLPQIQQQPNISVGGGTVNDLREVLRFDITPGWLPQRFARVTTVTSNVKMDGLRVPLISGTQAKDIAGSLTYFFDANQSLKRIQLHGITGDPTEIARLMVQFYGLQPEASLGGKLFTARWNNRVTSVLQVAPAPIIYAGADHSKYILFLELNQPSNQYGLSDEASEILRTSQATQRW